MRGHFLITRCLLPTSRRKALDGRRSLFCHNCLCKGGTRSSSALASEFGSDFLRCSISEEAPDNRQRRKTSVVWGRQCFSNSWPNLSWQPGSSWIIKRPASNEMEAGLHRTERIPDGLWRPGLLLLYQRWLPPRGGWPGPTAPSKPDCISSLSLYFPPRRDFPARLCLPGDGTSKWLLGSPQVRPGLGKLTLMKSISWSESQNSGREKVPETERSGTGQEWADVLFREAGMT